MSKFLQTQQNCALPRKTLPLKPSNLDDISTPSSLPDVKDWPTPPNLKEPVLIITKAAAKTYLEAVKSPSEKATHPTSNNPISEAANHPEASRNKHQN